MAHLNFFYYLVLWCYKKELGFSSHRKKKMKQLQKKIKSGKLDVNEDDPFELFIASTNIRYAYYHETHKILGTIAFTSEQFLAHWYRLGGDGVDYNVEVRYRRSAIYLGTVCIGRC